MKLRRLSLWMLFGSIFFALGLLGGSKIYNFRRANEEGRRQPLKILSLSELFDQTQKAKLMRDLGRRLEFTEVATPEDVWEALEKRGANFDVVSLFSYQMPLAVQLERVRVIDRGRINNFGLISPDFANLPGDPSLKAFLPTLWAVVGIAYRDPLRLESVPYAKLLDGKFQIGFPDSTVELLRAANAAPPAPTSKNKTQAKSALQTVLKDWFAKAQFSDSALNIDSLLKDLAAPPVLITTLARTAYAPLKDSDWHFSFPAEGATFWILGFGLAHETNNEEAAYEFLNAVSSPEIAEGFVRFTHQASVNRAVEKTRDLDPRLKPSYLRKLNLDDLNLWMDFSRAREVREIMKSERSRP